MVLRAPHRQLATKVLVPTIAVLLSDVVPFTGIGLEIEEQVLSPVIDVLPLAAPCSTLGGRRRAGGTGRRRHPPEQRPLHAGALLQQSDEVDPFGLIAGWRIQPATM